MITKFSILIANYNNGRFFKDCYDSIIAQTYTNWEAIIVDDASTDNSLELINKLIQDDSRFKLYSNETNGGCGYTKRRCVELAKGEICGFLDPDDALISEALEVMVDGHNKYSDASLIYSNFYICTPELKVKTIYRNKSLQSSYLESLSYVTHFASFKTYLYLKTEGIDSFVKRAVDQDLYYKCEEVAPIKYIDAVLYKYRIHDKGISTMSNSNKSIAWHYYVIMEACKRRGVAFEDIIANRITLLVNPQKNLLQKICIYLKTFI